jgi:hypothetical protein
VVVFGASNARRIAGLWVVTAVSIGCSGAIDKSGAPAQARASSQTARACVPGIQLACQCGDGSLGVATCDDAGRGFAACSCPNGRTLGMPTVIFPDAVAETGAGGAGAPPPTAPAPELARGVRIAELALYQAVKVPLMKDGDAIIERNAPVVVGKEATLRVFVEPLSSFQPRELRARLELRSAGKADKPLEVMQRMESDSSDAQFGSTINFKIPASSIAAGTEYAVSLWETGAPPAGIEVDPNVRWPNAEAELAPLGARNSGPLRIVFVPYRYTADGSDRLPSMDDEEIENYKAALAGTYPASEIEFEVHEPVDFNQRIGPTTGWTEWLEFHCALRAEEDPDPKVLYYGTIAPARDFRAYGGGIVGVSPVPNAASNYGRCSVGVGFPGFESTMIHELGHALGLEHAPCGTDGGPFPYDEGRIGVWGLLGGERLLAPTEYYDVMSYCDPTFISDYNFQRLFERIRYLNLQFDVELASTDRLVAGGTYRRILVDADGNATSPGTVDLKQAPGGPEDSRALTLLDGNGNPVGETQAFYFPFSEQSAGLWLVPTFAPGLAVRIDGVGDVSLR